MMMEAGWYLKTADAPEAHWWDGAQYTAHTSPLTGYPFAVHPDPLAAPVAVAPPAPPAAPEPITPEPDVASTPEPAVEPPVEVQEELPIVEPVTGEPVAVEPIVDAAPPVEPATAVLPPFTPPTLAAPEPQFGPPEPTVPVAQNFGPPQPTVPAAQNFGAPQPTVPVIAPGQPHPGYGATQTAGTSTEPRKGMNKGLLWGIIGGGALVLIIIIVLIANLLSSVFASNPITSPVVPPVATSEPTAASEGGDPIELPDDSATGETREIDASTREIFAGLVTSSIPTLAEEPEDSIVDGGLAVCAMFDDSMNVTDIGTILTQSGLSPSEAGLFLGYSVALLCPEYTDVVSG